MSQTRSSSIHGLLEVHEQPGTQKSIRNLAVCRTCQRCRTKKVKCDGQRPRCRACRSRGHECEYPRDARRSATRASQSDPQRDERQRVGSLQEHSFSQEGGYHPTTEMLEHSEATQLPPFDTPLSQFGAWNDTAAIAPHPANLETFTYPLAPLDSGDHIQTDCHSHMAQSSPHIHVHRGREQDVSGPSQTSRSNHDRPMSPLSENGEAELEETEKQIYGATSILRPQVSRATSAYSPAVSQHDRIFLRDVARDRLIAYAALQRQQELCLFSTPNPWENIDFDGVSTDMGMHLLNLHWNRQHLSYLVSYRPAIMDSLVNNGPYSNKLLLNAIFFSGSLYSDRSSLQANPQEPQTRGISFYKRFKVLLADYIDQPSIPTVAALLICGASLVPHGKQGAGWVFTGIAYRMIIDLGYHLELQKLRENEADSRHTAADVEIRRRIYWGAYVTDKFQSLFLGRAPTLQTWTGTTSREYLDSYEEMEEWKPYLDLQAQPSDASIPPYPGRPAYALSTFNCLLDLTIITASIMDAFYSNSGIEVPRDTLLQKREDIRSKLQQWERKLPTHLRFDPQTGPVPPPHQITPHTTYWTLIILVEQAFLSNGNLNFESDEEFQADGRQRCIEAALKIWRFVEAYMKTFTLRRAQFSIAYATYCAVLVILQQTQRDCGEYVETIHFFWLALLEFQKGCCFGLKKPLRILKSLMFRVKGLSQAVDGFELQIPNNTITYPIGQTVPEQASTENWDRLWFDTSVGEESLIDESIFGLFMS